MAWISCVVFVMAEQKQNNQVKSFHPRRVDTECDCTLSNQITTAAAPAPALHPHHNEMPNQSQCCTTTITISYAEGTAAAYNNQQPVTFTIVNKLKQKLTRHRITIKTHTHTSHTTFTIHPKCHVMFRLMCIYLCRL